MLLTLRVRACGEHRGKHVSTMVICCDLSHSEGFPGPPFRGAIEAWRSHEHAPSSRPPTTSRSARSTSWPSAETVAVKKTPGAIRSGSFGCSEAVGRGGVEPPTFRFSRVATTQLTVFRRRGRRWRECAGGCTRMPTLPSALPSMTAARHDLSITAIQRGARVPPAVLEGRGRRRAHARQRRAWWSGRKSAPVVSDLRARWGEADSCSRVVWPRPAEPVAGVLLQ